MSRWDTLYLAMRYILYRNSQIPHRSSSPPRPSSNACLIRPNNGLNNNSGGSSINHSNCSSGKKSLFGSKTNVDNAKEKRVTSKKVRRSEIPMTLTDHPHFSKSYHY